MALDLTYNTSNAPYLMGLNGLMQLNPTDTFGGLDTQRPAFTFAPESSSFDIADTLTLDAAVIQKAMGGVPDNVTPYSMTPATPTGAMNNISSTMSDYFGGLKRQGQIQQFQGAALRTVSSAVNVFDDLINWGTRRENIELQEENTKQAADNAMLAIDNQTLYVKNQLMDKFNNLVAQNSVTMAARNLKVSSGALLEASKETANDINMDFRTLESNADLQKAALENAKKQAEILADHQKTNQVLDFIGDATKLGLNIATGGGTSMSWGNLLAGYNAATAFQMY